MPTLVTDLDIVKVADRLETWRRWPGDDRDSVAQLQRTLNTAGVVRSDDIPAGVVTLDSRVRVTDLADAREATYTLVLGARAGADDISVLSPIGAALLGRREGDEVTYRVDGERRRLAIAGVLYQPEAAARPAGRGRIQEGDM